MDRRLATVLGASLVFALVVSGVFYQVVVGARGGGARKSKLTEVVVAARALPVGIVLKKADLKLARLPVEQAPQDGFAKIEDTLDRAVISSVLPEEPLRAARLSLPGAGPGLAPVIPAGMRAAAVKVNDVIGVAGFVLPGMRVDVLVTGRPPGAQNTVAKTALQDILVLSAGQTLEPDARGKPTNATVVTLLLTPAQAETLALCNEGRVQLVLRNTGDRELAQTPGRELLELYGRPAPPPVAAAAKPRPATAPVKPAPPPAPVAADIVVIRGTTRTVEQVALPRAQP